jgi:signal transduction histidine kinase
LSNAIKFSPRERIVFIRIFKDGQKLCIAVKDQGPGLTQEDKEKLFTPYQRLSASPTAGENSTGLGLSIAKRLMEELHGDLWCESSEGLGACFIMELPYQLTPEEEPIQIEIPRQATEEDTIHPIVVLSEERPSIVFAGR